MPILSHRTLPGDGDSDGSQERTDNAGFYRLICRALTGAIQSWTQDHPEELVQLHITGTIKLENADGVFNTLFYWARRVLGDDTVVTTQSRVFKKVWKAPLPPPKQGHQKS